MPIYDFKCLNDNYIFSLNMSVKDYETIFDDKIETSKLKCPNCQSIVFTRIYTPFAIHTDTLTRVEKELGTTKHRKEFAKYARDCRDKRKKQAEPGTREAESNEIWLNNSFDPIPVKK